MIRRNGGPFFAFGIDGEVYMNVLELDGVDALEHVSCVVDGDAVLFVGVHLRPAERRRLARHLADGGSETAAFIAGGRHWRKKRR